MAGLLVIGAGAIMVAVAVSRSGALARWAGITFALGFAFYIPQFFATQPIRVAHGVLVAVGCLWLASVLWTGCRGRLSQ